MIMTRGFHGGGFGRGGFGRGGSVLEDLAAFSRRIYR